MPCLFLLLGVRGVAEPEKKTVDGVVYHILRVPPESVRILWKDAQGRQLGTFPAAARYLLRNGETATVMMNGGIFEPGRIPSGLLIQDGKVLTPVNREKGKGNFFLEPNGIFLIGSEGAAVVRTDEYPLKDVAVHWAVQSGPLLLRKGKVHPRFNASSTSRLHRNGVGVTTDGDVVFAITDFESPKRPNLYEFARLFVRLDCPDALFLDGDLSLMRWGDEVSKPSGHFASIIAVTEMPDSGSSKAVESEAAPKGE